MNLLIKALRSLILIKPDLSSEVRTSIKPWERAVLNNAKASLFPPDYACTVVLVTQYDISCFLSIICSFLSLCVFFLYIAFGFQLCLFSRSMCGSLTLGWSAPTKPKDSSSCVSVDIHSSKRETCGEVGGRIVSREKREIKRNMKGKGGEGKHLTWRDIGMSEREMIRFDWWLWHNLLLKGRFSSVYN